MEKMSTEERLSWRLQRYTDYTKGRLHPGYDKYKIGQIDVMTKNKIYFNRQFIDAEPGLTTNEYNKWLKKSKTTFFHTIPTNSLLMGSNEENIRRSHSNDELYANPLTGFEYGPFDIMSVLNLLDIYTIMSLLGEDIKVETIGPENNYKDNLFVTAIGKKIDGSSIKLASRPYFGAKSICSIDETGKINYDYKNANEVLFRALKLPLTIVFNSVHEAIDPYHLPNEAVSLVPVNDELCEKVLRIKKSDGYRRFTEKKK
jgi:hypothetical protein